MLKGFHMITMVPIYPKEPPKQSQIVDAFGVTHAIELPASFWILDADRLMHEFHVPKRHIIKAGPNRFIQVTALEIPAGGDSDLIGFPVPSTKGRDALRIACESIKMLC